MRWSLLGHKARDFRPLTAVSLEDLIPEDNFYRQGERSIDLSFVRDLTNDLYSNIGRTGKSGLKTRSFLARGA